MGKITMHEPPNLPENWAIDRKQATVLVMELISEKDFEGLSIHVTPEILEHIKKFTANWDEEQLKAVFIESEDVQFIEPRVKTIKTKNDLYFLVIELTLVAFKADNVRHEALLVDVTTQLKRIYSPYDEGEWIISNIGPLRIKVYDTKTGRLKRN